MLPTQRPYEEWRSKISLLLIALGWFSLLFVSSLGLPIVWDEGNAMLRATRLSEWFGLWFPWLSGSRTESPLSPHIIHSYWNYTTQIEGHPAFYGAAIAFGQCATSSLLDPLTSARVGPMLLFSVAMAAMYARLRSDYSALAAWCAMAAVALQPRLFAHAHFASFDGPLTACWVLTWASFRTAMRGGAWRIAWGVALGMTMSCKATGWIAIVPFIAWLLLFFDRRALVVVATGVGIAILTFWLLNATLWHDPLGGLRAFLALNFGRGNAPHLNIPILFFGSRYDLDRPLPWYNTLAWTCLTVPPCVLLCGTAGIVSIAMRWTRDRAGVLLLANWAVLLIVRALPFAPPHDGERLILPSFAFLSAVAGVGCHFIFLWARAAGARRRTLVAFGLGVLASSGLVNMAAFRPQWLSYYSELVGGPRGAAAMGLEPTYYWDSLDSTVLAWIHAHTAPSEKVYFAGKDSMPNMKYLVSQGLLTRGYLAEHSGRYRWYVLQIRPGQFTAADRLLRRTTRPVFRRTIAAAPWFPLLWDTPLLEVYHYSDLVAAEKEIRRTRGPM